MASNSKIEWTDHTFNGWWGCEKVHAGCANCYAESTDKRWGGGHWGSKSPRRFILGEWGKPEKWQREAERDGVIRRVFCSSMCDVFEDHDGPMVDVHGNAVEQDLDSCRFRIFELIEKTPNLLWLLLTKRPENVRSMVPYRWILNWPENVMTGTSPCDQHTADKCIPALLKVPGKRFLSCEPLVGGVDFGRIPHETRSAEEARRVGGLVNDWEVLYQNPLSGFYATSMISGMNDGERIHWVIVGGESGSKARPMDIWWARSIRDQCQAARVPVFIKQMGRDPYDGLEGCEEPIGAGLPESAWLNLKDKKGGDWSEWPEDLRVREYPEVSA